MGLGTVFLSHYRRHPGQLAGLLLILVCAAMLWSGVRSLTGRAEEAVAQSRAALEPRLVVVRVDGRAVDVDDFARLRRAGLCASPRLQVYFPAPEAPELVGIDPFTAACLRQYSGGAPLLEEAIDELMADLDRPLLLGSAADLARWRELSLPGAADYRLEQAGGVPPGTLLADIAVAAELAPAGRAQLEILLPAAELETRSLPPGYRTRVEDYGVEPDSLVEAFLLNLDALGALALLVAALLVRSIYRFALEQRRRTLEILVRLGVQVSRLRLVLATEVLLLALVGGSVGVWLGGMLASAMAGGFRWTLSGLFSVEALAQRPPAAETWLGMVLILAIVVGWASLDLLMLRRNGRNGEKRAARMGGRRRPWAGSLVPLLLIAVSLAALLAAEKLWLIFVATTGCLAGAGLLLPGLLDRLLARAERHSRRPLLEWSCAEMRALCRLLQLPLVALAFAIAAAVGVQAMVTGFESTFARWLDQRLQGDLYLDPGRPVDPADWSGRLRDLPGVNTVLPMVRGRGLLGARSVDVLAVDPASPLLRDWPFLDAVPRPWAALSQQGVLVNEQLARRQSLGVGDEIRFVLGAQPLTRSVIGIYADYGRPEGELLLPVGAVPDALPGRYTTFVLGVADADSGWRDWPAQYPWLAGSRLRDQAGLKQAANTAFARTFQMTRLLNGLTLALAGTALALMGVVIFRLRQRSYTLLHVYGVPRRQLRHRLIVHSMLVTGLQGILATPLGIFLSWVLVAGVNPAAFGWALPLYLYPGFWLQVWLACLLIGAVVGALMRDPVRLETLKNE
ncbi:ABC transporter permease [Microbulbifer yueqingensis]|uniref:Putative ABC transport system permease protein n=1 Tax=Microbulbifer yueqingensis TaxID=658219 RepID=A0A1G9CL15_9GAMM|nr:ABC transporter permease [Microbulbifer yueqingensis]SDK52286.1 putative ABC transport system permease protein [Microbulbifer yueqingensis]